MGEIDTYAQAARVTGVAAVTIKAWVDSGKLPTGPWTEKKLLAASGAQHPRGGRPSTSVHGTVSRWRHGCDCDACRDAHNREIRTMREDRRTAWWADKEDALIELVARGGIYGEILEEIGISAAAVTAHRRRDQGFAERLDEGLFQGRDETLTHGTGYAWRQRCRCPECRAYHEATR